MAFPIKTGAVIILSHPSQFILKGKATVQPLAGSVTIMGHLLKDSRKTYNIYSPECSSLLTLETVAGESNKDCIMKSVSSHISRNEDIEILRDKLEDFKSAVIFKVTSLFPSLGDIVRTLPPCQYLFSMGGDWDHTMNNVLSPLGFELFQSPNAPHLEVTNELREAIDDWTESLSQRNKGNNSLHGQVVSALGPVIQSVVSLTSSLRDISASVAQLDARPTGDQEVAGSTPAEVGNILSWRLIMKYFLRSFSPFR